MDPLAPSITFYDKESGKGRVTYLGAVPRPHLARARARTRSPPRSIRPSASDLTRDPPGPARLPIHPPSPRAGNLIPEYLFYPTPGLWFTNQGREVRAARRARGARHRPPLARDGAAPRDPRPSNRSPASPPPRSPQLMDKLTELYIEEPYPTVERMEEIAKDVGAPDYKKIESFFVNMRLKHQERHQ